MKTLNERMGKPMPQEMIKRCVLCKQSPAFLTEVEQQDWDSGDMIKRSVYLCQVHINKWRKQFRIYE